MIVPQVVTHQYNVGHLHGDIGAGCARRDADRRGCKRGASLTPSRTTAVNGCEVRIASYELCRHATRDL
jgi:hypothetical protein